MPGRTGGIEGSVVPVAGLAVVRCAVAAPQPALIVFAVFGGRIAVRSGPAVDAAVVGVVHEARGAGPNAGVPFGVVSVVAVPNAVLGGLPSVLLLIPLD